MKILKYVLFPLAIYVLGVSVASVTIWGLAPINPANWDAYARLTFCLVTVTAWATFLIDDFEVYP